MFRFTAALVFVLWCPVVYSQTVGQAQDHSQKNFDACDPWFPDQTFPKLITPKWVDEEGVEAVVVLAIDDMRDTAKYEQYLRPILSRLKQIDGRAPVSIMTCNVRPDDPQLQSWLEEGLSIEVHTVDHPCPILQAGDFEKAKSTYDRCIDLLAAIPGNKPVAFRTPCCDSLNTVSPRFYSEIFPSKSPEGNYLQIDSSVVNFFTSDDSSIPRNLVLDEDGKERFWKYLPRNNNYKGQTHDHFMNYIRNYPYPYVINNSCWQFPCVAPSDWSAQHLHGVDNPVTIADWKAALDITVHKQGVFNLIFHPHGWVSAENIVDLIDHAVTKHGNKIKFLTFREVADRLNKTLTAGKTLRDANDAVLAKLSAAEFRQNHDGDRGFRSVPDELRQSLESGELPGLPAIWREDGSHNGFFFHGDHLCWQNEDTAGLPDLTFRISINDALKAARRRKKTAELPPVPIGAAVVDVTPEYPVRLTGYGNRTAESEGIATRIHARALAFGVPACVLVTVDNCGVPADVVEAVFERVAAKHEITRERFAISSTHTHSGPWLRGFAPNVLTDLPADHAEHLKQYEAELIQKVTAAVDEALEKQRPGYLSRGTGQVGFAINRRVIADGSWLRFGETPDGPVDHQMPILAAHDTDGKLIAVLANYACHATTETGKFNQISGDWPGFAADLIEADNPGAVALIAIGCGADANPSPRGTHDQAAQHGKTFADEVKRLLNATGTSRLERISPHVECSIAFVDLPLGPLPARSEWEELSQQPTQSGVLATKFLAMLDHGQPIPSTVPNYPVQTWCFGEDLGMVFLGGEVVVDYSIRLNTMFNSERLWINAYSNDVPCYIASKRILREGGYEADRSMVYYGHPTRLAPEAEDLICDTVQKQLPHQFYSTKLQASFPAPKSPEESLSCISTHEDLRVELVAAEPLITDPVAFDWDVQGRLWVVEMGDYPSGAGTPRQATAAGAPRQTKAGKDGLLHGEGNAPDALSEQTRGGRVRVLEDLDGDGRYDHGTTFLDNLSFPTGIHRWRNGVLITAAPDIIYAEDTDGDLKADVRKLLYSGFVEGNQQHRVNGLRWSLDGWLHLANGDSGGKIKSVSGVLATGAGTVNQTVDIGGRDLRIRPDHGQIESLSGRAQFGRERDDFGNWFGNNNSNPIWHYVLEDHYLLRNPHATGATTKADVSETPGAAPVFPTSKTQARFNDFDKANRFTSACSTAIYRDILLGDEFYGNAFTCEPVHNLVSRLVLKRDGVTFKGRRAENEQRSEFFASSDNWTRPVMVRTGPDGAIYIADMYRQVIEHPQWIPAEYQRKMNLYAGSNKGRIYRVVPGRPGGRGRGRTQEVSQRNRRDGHTEGVGTVACCEQVVSGSSQAALTAEDVWASIRSDTVAEDKAEQRNWFDQPWDRISVDELSERLSSPNGWWRDTVQRLLSHNGNVALPLGITELTRSHPVTAVRVQAMYVVTSLNSDRSSVEAMLRASLNDKYPEVRRAAIELLESVLSNGKPELVEALSQLADDPSLAVRHQLALSLGEADGVSAAATLAQLLMKDRNSPYIVSAVITSLNPKNVAAVLQQVMRSAAVDGNIAAKLIGQAAAMKQSRSLAAPIKLMLNRLAYVDAPESAGWWTSAALIMTNISESREVETTLKGDAQIATAINETKQIALNLVKEGRGSTDVQLAALDFLSGTEMSSAETEAYLLPRLSPATPVEVQQAVINAIGRSSQDILASLFDRWDELTPAVRSSIVDQLLVNTSRTKLLLDGLGTNRISVSDLDASAREQLLNLHNGELKSQAHQLLGANHDSARQPIVDSYASQLTGISGDPASGKQVFEKRCATCHKLQGIGKSIGADLMALKDRSTKAMLTAILDPNKAVETKFLSYTAVTTRGLGHSGMLISETGNSVTLMGADGKEKVIARTDLESLHCSNRSLMPEGLEKDLSPQALADVISFVQTSGIRWKRFDGNTPQLITASTDGTLTLSASDAEIYGPNLVYEQKYGNIGFWQSTDDYAVWNIDVPHSGLWTVEIDYACESRTAGNAIKLSTGNRLLSARVPGTGTWNDYRTWTMGKIDLGRGRRQLTITAPEKPTFALIDLRSVRLLPPD